MEPQVTAAVLASGRACLLAPLLPFLLLPLLLLQPLLRPRLLQPRLQSLLLPRSLSRAAALARRLLLERAV